VVIIGEGQGIIQVGAVANEHRFLDRPAVALQQLDQALHILDHGGFVGRPTGPGLVKQGESAISADIKTYFELLLVHRRVMSKTEINQVAVGILTVGNVSTQIVEDQG
jgi:hypothetical protein